jgi:hypothetical protein
LGAPARPWEKKSACCSRTWGRSAERHISRGEEGEKLQGKAPRRVHCSSSDQRRSAPWLEQRGLLSLQPPWLGVSQASPRSGASWALPEPTGSFSAGKNARGARIRCSMVGKKIDRARRWLHEPGCGQVHGNCGLASRGANQERPKMAVGWRSKTSKEEWSSSAEKRGR